MTQKMRFPTGPIIGLGCDLVTISRIKYLLSDHPDQFRDFAFSSQEQLYCDKQAFPYQHYAARWAVKEAFIKALEVSETSPDLASIEVISEPTPQLLLTSDGLDLLAQKASETNSSIEDATIDVSMSHEKETDIAIGVILILFDYG